MVSMSLWESREDQLARLNLAIVGSSELGIAQENEALWLISIILQHYKPLTVISGGAEGVDTIAEDTADYMGIPTNILLPTYPSWDGHKDGRSGYRVRNIKIANACDFLIAIRSKFSKTYGSGWTADYAEEELNKPVRRLYI